MRYRTLAAVALVVAAFGPAIEAQEERGTRRVSPEEALLQRFDPAQSAGFFVGVRTFLADETLAEVPYAVDDAIDLAHLFAIELGLIPPARVTLALSLQSDRAAHSVSRGSRALSHRIDQRVPRGL